LVRTRSGIECKTANATRRVQRSDLFIVLEVVVVVRGRWFRERLVENDERETRERREYLCFLDEMCHPSIAVD